MSAGGVLESSQVTLDWFILLSIRFWLHLPLLSVTHWRLVSEEATECTASPPSLLGQNLKSPPSTNRTFNLDTQLYSSTCQCPLRSSQLLSDDAALNSKQSHVISQDRLKCRWEEIIKGKQARHVSKPSISTAFVCKSLVCAETHFFKPSVLSSLWYQSSTCSLFFIKRAAVKL